MTSDPPPPVPRASGRPARVRRPPSPSSLLAKGVQRAGRRPDQLARWWNELEEVVLLLRAENVGAAAAGAARLSREAEQAVEEGDGGADEQWALLGAARTVLGLAHDEQPGGEPAQPVYAAAVDAFERAGTWATGRGNVVAYHGQALLGAGRPAEAAEMLRHAASGLGEDTPDVRRSLGVALARAGRLAEAENVLLDAVARAPYDWRAHRALAQTGERLDRPADVLSDRWAAAAAAHPDPDTAVAAYERARSHSATATVLLALGVSYAAAGRAADAERSLREADRMRPSGRTRLQIADMVALQGDTREAAAVAASALPLGVEEADVLVGLGAHLLAADRLHEFDRAMHGLPPALMPVVEAYQSVSLVRRGRVTEGT